MSVFRSFLISWALIFASSCVAKEPSSAHETVKVTVESASTIEETSILVDSHNDSIVSSSEDNANKESESKHLTKKEATTIKQKGESRVDNPPSHQKENDKKPIETDVIQTDSNTSKDEMGTPVTEKVADEPKSRGVEAEFTQLSYLDVLNALLRSYVDANGDVDYQGLKKEMNALKELLSLLLGNSPDDSWSRNEKLAYWINLYNVATLKLIVDNYPISSITKLEGGKPWDTKWIKVGERNLSLNNIENDIIRPEFKEPRIHFAVNCAAASCPPLLNEAFDPEKLDSQLDQQTKAFLNNSAYNVLSSSSLKLSKIFDWYKEDFGDINEFVAPYVTEDVSGASTSYLEYDWSLNKQ